MTIFRNGTEYELTKKEIYDAYLEQEDAFDLDDITNELDDLLMDMEEREIVDKFGLSSKMLHELIPAMVSRYREYYDSNDWINEARWNCRTDAIRRVAEEQGGRQSII